MASKNYKFFKLKFSPGTHNVDGVSMDEAPENEAAKMSLIKLQSTGKELTEKEAEFAKKGARSKRDQEKNILQILIHAAAGMTENKPMARYNKLLRLAARVEDVDKNVEPDQDCFVEVESEEIEIIRKGVAEIKERPMWWRKCIEIFDQLENPEEIKESESTLIGDAKPA